MGSGWRGFWLAVLFAPAAFEFFKHVVGGIVADTVGGDDDRPAAEAVRAHFAACVSGSDGQIGKLAL